MRHISFLVATVFSTAACLPAQTPVKLSLEEAEALAVKNHPQLQAAQNAASAMGQRVNQAKSAYFPQLSGDVTGSQANPRARIGAGLLTDPSLFNRFGQGITLSQLITDSGRTHNLVASSRLQASAADQTTQATKFDVLVRVNQAYYAVLRAQSTVKIADETVKTRQTIVDQISELFRNKLRSQVDLSFVEVNLSEAKLMVLQAQDQVQGAFAELTRTIGSQQAATYELAEQPLPPSPPKDAEDLVAQAIGNRPELAGLQMSRDAAYRFERAEKALSYPTVNFLGVGGYIPYISQLSLPRVTPPEYEGAAVNVEIPIFNGGLFKARRREAHYRAMEADQRLRDEAETIVRDVRTAWAAATLAYQRMDVTKQLLAQATLAMQLAQLRYDNGLSNIVELTQAQLSVTAAQIEDLTAKYDYQTDYAILQYSMGALR